MLHRKTSQTTKILMLAGISLTFSGGIGTFAVLLGYHLLNLSFMSWFYIMGAGVFLAFAWQVLDCREQGITFSLVHMQLIPPED